MSVPESIAWLETSRDSKSPSASRIYATAILAELTRLSQQLDECAHEIDARERLHQEAVDAYRVLRSTFEELEEKVLAAREEWDAERAVLEERIVLAEQGLREVGGLG